MKVYYTVKNIGEVKSYIFLVGLWEKFQIQFFSSDINSEL